MSDIAHGTHAGFGESFFFDLVFDFGLGGGAFQKAACRANDVLGFDLHRDFAGAIGFVKFDGCGRSGLEDLGKTGKNLVMLESEVAHGGVAIDLDSHHATGEAAVGIHLGGALGHDFLMALGAGKCGISHDIDDLVVGGAIGFRIIGGGDERTVLKALAFDNAVERVDDLANLDGTDDLDSAVG